MKYWFALLCFPVFLGAAGPVPIVAGAVRDQFGDPIAGARVSANGQQTQTDAGGLFSLRTAASAVTISCDYCMTQAAAVSADGTVAAVVRRFHAVAADTPTRLDVRVLPYARPEQVLSLRPYAVLFDGSTVLPGPRIALYGANRFGGLTIDNGAPAYDTAAGGTPFRTSPLFDVAQIDIADIFDAPRYGDLAGAGTFALQTQNGQTQADALAGGQSALRFSQAGQNGSMTLALSNDGYDNASRLDAAAMQQVAGGTLSARAALARDRYVSETDGTWNAFSTAAQVHYAAAGPWQPYADVVADRSGYGAKVPAGVTATWSDLGVSAGVERSGEVALFADAAARFSNASYLFDGYNTPQRNDAIVQTHASAGVRSSTEFTQWSASVGAFDVALSGSAGNAPVAQHASILSPEASLRIAISPNWSAALGALQSFRLPVTTELSAQTGALRFDRIGEQNVQIQYTDLRRLRIGISAFNADYGNLDAGSVRAAGGFVDWQVAPDLSVRAWSLHFDDTTQPQIPVFRYDAGPPAATPASLWFAYRNENGMTADLLWRRDVLDTRTATHADASVTGPLSEGIRWFAATASRQNTRFWSFGLRFER